MSDENYFHGQLQKQLQKPGVPDELKEKIFSNWDEQLNQRKKSFGYRSFLAFAASLLLVVLTWFSVDTTPQFVYLAMSDIQDDLKHNKGLSVELDNIMKDFHINTIPKSMQVNMTKHCSLDDKRTVHLQLTSAGSDVRRPLMQGELQGDVHVFLNEGEMESSIWEKSMGDTKLMSWKLINPRPGLSVLIFFSGTMKVEAVDNITKNMFYI